jgi:hypothetical protein
MFEAPCYRQPVATGTLDEGTEIGNSLRATLR